MTIIQEQCGPLTLVYDDGSISAAEHLAILRRSLRLSLASQDMDRVGELILEIFDLEAQEAEERVVTTSGNADPFDQELIDQGSSCDAADDVVRWDVDDVSVTMHYDGDTLSITASENGRTVRHETRKCCMQDFLSHVERLTGERGKPVWLVLRP